MCLGTLLLMTPFLWALISNKYNSSELFLKLWRDENYNHGRLVSLVLGRVSVALFFITSVVISYFKLNWGISVIIAIAVVALILIFREDLTQYSRLETRFLANLNRREEVAKKRHPLKTSFNSEFNDKDLDLTSILVSPYSDYIGKSLGELSFRQNFGVNVVAITRGDLNIYIPKSSEHIYPQDKLTVVGTDTQLQEFRNRIEDVKNTSDMDAVDKKITLHSFTVDEEFRFLNQTIAQSHLGEKHDSIVVAIERNDELITLDKDTLLQDTMHEAPPLCYDMQMEPELLLSCHPKKYSPRPQAPLHHKYQGFGFRFHLPAPVLFLQDFQQTQWLQA